VALVVLVVVVLLAGGLTGSRQELPYSRFLGLVNAGRVEKVAIGSRDVTGTYRSGDHTVRFTATRPPDLSDTSLVRNLQAHRVQFTGDQPSALGGLLGSLLLICAHPQRQAVGAAARGRGRWFGWCARGRPALSRSSSRGCGAAT
jgi:ATP-dependent Zn protease